MDLKSPQVVLLNQTGLGSKKSNDAIYHIEGWSAKQINKDGDWLNIGQIMERDVQDRQAPVKWYNNQHANFQKLYQTTPVGLVVVVAACTAARPTGAAEAGFESLLIVGVSAVAGTKISVIVPHGCLLYTVQVFWSMAHRQAATSGYTL